MDNAVPIRVLIADDHPAVREGLATLLAYQKDIKIVGLACDGREAVELFKVHQPDVLLIDLHMPVLDGLTAAKFVLSEFPKARIILLTLDHLDVRDEAEKAGVAVCLSKDTPRSVLLSSIRDIHIPIPTWI